MANVKLINVEKKYGKSQTPAVCDFNLEIADKEFIVFVGPSGCGKSTTLRMIAGLEEITSGTIEIDGKVVNDLPPKERGIAMVFQNYALYPNLTVFENMAFPLRLLKTPKDETDPKTGKVKKKYEKLPNEEITKRVMEAADILGITEYLMRRPRELSGGQRQRVAIGRAMVRDSKVFLLDEPLSNLDAKLRNQMRAELILLRKKIDTTFIYVTHDQTEAMTLGDRIVVMKDGYIQQVGTPAEVFDMPNNLFVAEFIGSPKMNTFKTRLEKDANGYFVSLCGVRIAIDGEKGEALKARNIQAQDVVLGVRPEHVSLTKRDNPSAIPCTIQVNEMMGSEVHLHVLTPQQEQIIVRIPTVSLDAYQLAALHAGVKIFITFRSKVMHFFGAENGRNLLADVACQAAMPTAQAPSAQSPAEEPKKKWRRMK